MEKGDAILRGLRVQGPPAELPAPWARLEHTLPPSPLLNEERFTRQPPPRSADLSKARVCRLVMTLPSSGCRVDVQFIFLKLTLHTLSASYC